MAKMPMKPPKKMPPKPGKMPKRGCWGVLRIPHQNRWHVIPNNDLREHDSSADCWCKPDEDDDTPGLFIHHSMDGREKYETGELLEH